jgi:hypothetical protein
MTKVRMTISISVEATVPTTYYDSDPVVLEINVESEDIDAVRVLAENCGPACETLALTAIGDRLAKLREEATDDTDASEQDALGA